MPEPQLTRRAVLLGAAAAAVALAGCGDSSSGSPSGVSTAIATGPAPKGPLWQTALDRGLVYGSSTATWQITDKAYRGLYEREAAILFTEDDLLWYRLRPTPDAQLDFSYGDRIIDFAENNGMLVFGAHLTWDEGFGDGWQPGDFLILGQAKAQKLLLETIRATVGRYKGRVAAWSVVNEAIDGNGVRTDVPWYQVIGPQYIADSFTTAHEADPDALLLYNDFGFETDDDYATAADKRQAALDLIDQLQTGKVPIHGLGVQAHLTAGGFDVKFDEKAYRRFLADVAKRKLMIFITELDVLDDGLPAATGPRDAAVAEVYRRYLSTALAEPGVRVVMTFGLSDRYTWLQEDYPRDDKAPRRPLPFDQHLKPKPAFAAASGSLAGAGARTLLWTPPRAHGA